MFLDSLLLSSSFPYLVEHNVLLHLSQVCWTCISQSTLKWMESVSFEKHFFLSKTGVPRGVGRGPPSERLFEPVVACGEKAPRERWVSPDLRPKPWSWGRVSDPWCARLVTSTSFLLHVCDKFRVCVFNFSWYSPRSLTPGRRWWAIICVSFINI